MKIALVVLSVSIGISSATVCNATAVETPPMPQLKTFSCVGDMLCYN